jgi:hypothetical protein
LAVVSISHAQGAGVAIRVEIEAPQGCTSVSDLEGRIRARVRGARFDEHAAFVARASFPAELPPPIAVFPPADAPPADEPADDDAPPDEPPPEPLPPLVEPPLLVPPPPEPVIAPPFDAGVPPLLAGAPPLDSRK